MEQSAIDTAPLIALCCSLTRALSLSLSLSVSIYLSIYLQYLLLDVLEKLQASKSVRRNVLLTMRCGFPR